MIKKIVLITTGQPSVNPRIVKEADALSAAGYHVTVLYCFWIDWALTADVNLLKNVTWKYKLIGGTPASGKRLFFFTKARLKVNKALNKLFGNKFMVAERAQARSYDELLRAAKLIKADWYIGHNLGTLPIAVQASRYNNAKCGFDFEDYHREEVNDMRSFDLQRIIYLENKYVPQLQYISTASSLITEKIKQNFPFFGNGIITILNCFPLIQQPAFRDRPAEENGLQLFWFSQTIGKNRGLEILFKALKELNDESIHVTLAGRYSKELQIYIEEFAAPVLKNIHFAGIIQPGNLPAFAATFDIGLAIELATPGNRNICLTNKIFTYLLAGNAVILSGTAAQKAFNDTYNIGACFTINDTEELKAAILYYKNGSFLEKQRKHNYELAFQTLNWKNESGKLLSLIN